MLKEKNVRRNEWPMGIVIEVNRSRDSMVRSATVRLAKKDSSRTTCLTRPINKMVLFIQAESGKDDDLSMGGVSRP